jgi:alkanesulfonate monooxygenase SsuD/methylene tetrahydromethanopterin reductase-like flavin-dependent oxidoreductase (luciferase family)
MHGGGTARWPELLAMARAAEAVGFDSLWVMDHLVGRLDLPGWEDHTIGFCEGWSLLAALAAVTERIALGPYVFSVPFRNPALLAKMADTVDEISDGRLILGPGAGWHEPEYDAFGYPFDHRASRFEEGFAIIRSLLRDEHANIHGTYAEASYCKLRPRGPRPGGPARGSAGDLATLLRAYAEIGVGHVVLWPDPCTLDGIDALAPLLERLDHA